MADKKAQARELLKAFKGDAYISGLNCFDGLGELAANHGRRAAVVASGVGKPWGGPIHNATTAALERAGVALAGAPIAGARPNSPREDVFRIADALCALHPEVVVAVGGGSTIDATKAAVAYLELGDQFPELDTYFGTGRISQMLRETGRTLLPLVAAQLASGSAAHLTKYANVTDTDRAQKLLIVDEAVVPPSCLYDYAWSVTCPASLTMDGALDGVAHCLEVYLGIDGAQRERCRPVSLLGIDLIIHHIETAVAAPDDLAAREALGLGTDLGGYAIMIGGTSGAHLTSFSLVDILPHGRACALMNPYYTVFFAPVVEDKLREVGEVYAAAGLTSQALDRLQGRDLGQAVADAMLRLSERIGFPTTLGEVPGFTSAHIDRALAAAKDPKLDMKLKNMPVPLSAELVDEYMRPVLEAAVTGDFSVIKNL